jgi:hypothetical protein
LKRYRLIMKPARVSFSYQLYYLSTNVRSARGGSLRGGIAGFGEDLKFWKVKQLKGSA